MSYKAGDVIAYKTKDGLGTGYGQIMYDLKTHKNEVFYLLENGDFRTLVESERVFRKMIPFEKKQGEEQCQQF